MSIKPYYSIANTNPNESDIIYGKVNSFDILKVADQKRSTPTSPLCFLRDYFWATDSMGLNHVEVYDRSQHVPALSTEFKGVCSQSPLPQITIGHQNLPNKTAERQSWNKQVITLLIPPDLPQGICARPVPVLPFCRFSYLELQFGL